MDDFERQDEEQMFHQINDQLAVAIDQVRGTDAVEVLEQIAGKISNLHQKYRALNDEEWEAAINGSYGLYTELSFMVTESAINADTRGKLKTQIDKYVDMLRFYRNRKGEKQTSVVEEPGVNAENMSISLDDIENYIDSFEGSIDFDKIYEQLSDNEKLQFEEMCNQYLKVVDSFAVKDTDIRDYLLLKLSTKNWLKNMNQEQLSSYCKERQSDFDDFSVNIIKNQRGIDEVNMNAYELDSLSDLENERDRDSSFYEGKYDMGHEARLYQKFNKEMENMYSLIEEKNKNVVKR